MDQVPIEKEGAETTENEMQAVDSAVPALIKRRTRIRPSKTKTLPSDRIRFGTQLELIRSYGVIGATPGKLVTVKEVADLIKLTENTTSLMNGFLVDNGFIQRKEGGFEPARCVIDFANAHQWNPETSSRKLFPVIEASWFAQAVVPPLKMRTLDEEEVLAKLAEASQASTEYRGHLRMLIDYMETAGLVQRDGTQIKLCKAIPPEGSGHNDVQPPPTDDPKKEKHTGINGSLVQPAGGVQFGINISVDMADLAGWAPERIAALFAGIAQVMSAKAQG